MEMGNGNGNDEVEDEGQRTKVDEERAKRRNGRMTRSCILDLMSFLIFSKKRARQRVN